MQFTRVLVVLAILSTSSAYILKSGQEPSCVDIVCSNGGSLLTDVCVCDCPSQFTGLFCDTEIKESIWPKGSYSLITTVFGCPEGDGYGWRVGYVNISTLVQKHVQTWKMPHAHEDQNTPDPHILGPYHYYTLQLNFCTRISSDYNNSLKMDDVTMTSDADHVSDGNTDVDDEETWPSGTYCILQAGHSCPGGFSNGSVVLGGYTAAVSDLGGWLPYQVIDNMTGSVTLRYCCRSDDETTIPILLPDGYPFLLIKAPNESCQQVYNMTVSEETFDFLSDEDWPYQGEHSIFLRKDEHHLSLGLCYYATTARRECYYKSDEGFSYIGTQNTSIGGEPCLYWLDVDYDLYRKTKHWVGNFDENHCRNYLPWDDDVNQPSCFINSTEKGVYFEACPVPVCEEEPGLSEFGAFKPVYAVENYLEFVAENTVDDDIRADPFQSNRPRQKPWIQVDLEEFIEVYAVLVYRRFMWFPVNFRFVGIHVSTKQWNFFNYGAPQCEERRYPRAKTTFRFTCYRPITGQYVTIRNFDDPNPENTWGQYFFLEVSEIKVIGKKTGCGRRMGMVSGEIRDFQISGSSDQEHFIYDQGRLLLPGNGWCASIEDIDPYFQVDLIAPMVVQGVEVQAWSQGGEVRGIRSFSVAYGVDEANLSVYKEDEKYRKIFVADTSQAVGYIHRFLLKQEIVARYVRLNILQYDGGPCLKMELLGCPKRVWRDLTCSPSSMDFGFDIVVRSSFWMTGESIPIYTFDTMEECIESCNRVKCIQATYNLGECKLMRSTRYSFHYEHWFIDNLHGDHSVTITRLCINGITKMEDCNTIIKEPATVRSPSFPFQYGQWSTCRINITFPKGQYARVEILDMFLAVADTEADLISTGVTTTKPGTCVDVLNVDGTDILFINHDYLRGAVIFSTQSEMEIRLSTCVRYSRNQAKGFLMDISYADRPGCPAPPQETCDVTCTASSAFIVSLGFPARMVASSCHWVIEGTLGQYVQLEFLVMDVWNPDDASGCDENYVSVFDVSLSRQRTEIGRYCSSKNPRQIIKSNWHFMELDYIVVWDNRGSGFQAQYDLIEYIGGTFVETSEGCNDGWYFYEDKCYKLFSHESGLTWLQAEDACLKMNGHLVSLDTRTEMMFIHNLLSQSLLLGNEELRDVYIGLKFLGTSGRYDDKIWSDGTPVTFTSWFNAEPEERQPDGSNNELCTFLRLYSIHSTQNWHDLACSYDKVYRYICEVPAYGYANDTASSVESPTFEPITVPLKDIFKCGSGETILSIYVCDDRVDCRDASDENCGKTCDTDSFTCTDGTCISVSLVCDFREDCPDGSDEQFCVHPPCNSDEWRCKSGQCISIGQRCDVKTDCLDNSDNEDCVTCASTAFQCYDQRCIPKSRVCDSYFDCYGKFHEDEDRNCSVNVHESCVEWFSENMGKDGVYHIHLGQADIFEAECNYYEEHDGFLTVQTIIHHDQEYFVNPSEAHFRLIPTYLATTAQIKNLLERSVCRQQIMNYCSFYTNNFAWTGRNGETVSSLDTWMNCSCPYVNKCNETCECYSTINEWFGEGDYDWWTDFGFITDHDQLPIMQWRSDDLGTVFLEKIRVRLGPLECEEVIEERITSSTISCSNQQTMSGELKCLLELDSYGEIVGCRDMTHLQNCTEHECPPSYSKCPESYCLPSRLVCDGIPHCLHSEDELYCDNQRPCSDQFRCHHSSVCISFDRVCDTHLDCPHGDDEQLCDFVCPSVCDCNAFSVTCLNTISPEAIHNSSNTLSKIRKLDLSYNQLKLQQNSFDLFDYLVELHMAHCSINNLRNQQFLSLSNLRILDISFNNIQTLISGTFSGLENLESISLLGNPIDQIDVGAFQDLIHIGILDLSGAKLTSIQPGTFDGLANLHTLNLSLNQIERVDGNSFQNLGILRLLDVRENQILTFDEKIFTGLDSLELLYTDSFTFCCLRPSSVTDYNCYPPRDEFSSCDDLMREEVLRAFLWIIGFLAFLGNTAVLILRLYFQRSSLMRTYGIFVTNLGIADFLMGIYLIILAIADVTFRGEYVWKDYQWRNGVFCKLAGVLATLATEGSVIFLCFITIDRLLVVKFPFGNIKLSRKSAILACVLSWLILFLIALLPVFPIQYFNDEFYSRSAVCLALPLTRDRPSGWEYAFAVYIVFNFIAFLLVATAQGVIYHEIFTKSAKITSTKRKQDIVVARNLFLVVITDFLCWFPVGLMGMLALNGHVISGGVYAWIAVFVLPINSALNPFLYTLGSTFNRQSTVRKKLSRLMGQQKEAVSSSIREVFESSLFMFAKRKVKTTTLRKVLEKRVLTVQEAAIVAIRAAKGLRKLHLSNLVHGSFTEDQIIVVEKEQALKGVALKSTPKEGEEEIEFTRDIADYGRVLKIIVASTNRK